MQYNDKTVNTAIEMKIINKYFRAVLNLNQELYYCFILI